MERTLTAPKDINLTTETIQVINTRRAIRKYKDKDVDRDIIEQVIKTGMMAPSAMNKQPWKFYVLTNKEMIRSFSREIAKLAFKEFSKSGLKGIIQTTGHLLHFAHNFSFHSITEPVFYGAPVVIFITAPVDNEWAPLDVGMCAQNMMLAAKSLGLDTCPVGFAKFVMHTGLYPSLKIPASEKVLLAVILGYGDEKPEVHERAKDKIVFIGQ
ncbi:MAG TPA: nitroreductase [Puia sp.]|nr:nitroreductase [Puia sp.]